MNVQTDQIHFIITNSCDPNHTIVFIYEKTPAARPITFLLLSEVNDMFIDDIIAIDTEGVQKPTPNCFKKCTGKCSRCPFVIQISGKISDRKICTIVLQFAGTICGLTTDGSYFNEFLSNKIIYEFGQDMPKMGLVSQNNIQQYICDRLQLKRLPSLINTCYSFGLQCLAFKNKIETHRINWRLDICNDIGTYYNIEVYETLAILRRSLNNVRGIINGCIPTNSKLPDILHYAAEDSRAVLLLSDKLRHKEDFDVGYFVKYV